MLSRVTMPHPRATVHTFQHDAGSLMPTVQVEPPRLGSMELVATTSAISACGHAALDGSPHSGPVRRRETRTDGVTCGQSGRLPRYAPLDVGPRAARVPLLTTPDGAVSARSAAAVRPVLRGARRSDRHPRAPTAAPGRRRRGPGAVLLPPRYEAGAAVPVVGEDAGALGRPHVPHSVRQHVNQRRACGLHWWTRWRPDLADFWDRAAHRW